MDTFFNKYFIPTGFLALVSVVILGMIQWGVINAPRMPVWLFFLVTVVLAVYGIFAVFIWMLSKSGI